MADGAVVRAVNLTSTTAMHGRRKSDSSVVCAGQRPDRVGSSPTGARMRGAISKSGGNASLAGESE
jgi:hypothetical protein